MGYLRSYLNEMLEKHPQGREFEEVRRLARYIGSYRPDKNVVPKEEADPKDTSIGKTTKKILPYIGAMSGFGSLDAGGNFRFDFLVLMIDMDAIPATLRIKILNH